MSKCSGFDFIYGVSLTNTSLLSLFVNEKLPYISVFTLTHEQFWTIETHYRFDRHMVKCWGQCGNLSTYIYIHLFSFDHYRLMHVEMNSDGGKGRTLLQFRDTDTIGEQEDSYTNF